MRMGVAQLAEEVEQLAAVAHEVACGCVIVAEEIQQALVPGHRLCIGCRRLVDDLGAADRRHLDTDDGGDHLQVGNQGRGFYDITGGTIELDSTFNGQNGPDDISNRILRIGIRAGSYGTMHVGGTALVHANELRLGEGSDVGNLNDAGRNNGGRARSEG